MQILQLLIMGVNGKDAKLVNLMFLSDEDYILFSGEKYVMTIFGVLTFADQGRCSIHHFIPIIAPEKALFVSWKVQIVFLILHKNICCGYSLEVPY